MLIGNKQAGSPMNRPNRELAAQELPGQLQHVGIIMDGNGRWAKRQGKPRIAGHNEGVKVSKEIVRRASDLGLPFLSLYVFSSENWKRPPKEVEHLMGLLQKHLRDELRFYIDNRIRVWHSGKLEELPRPVQNEIRYVIEQTEGFSGLTVNLLINYGGRQEVIDAIEQLHREGGPVTPESLRHHMYHGRDLPPLDLLIRTGGDQRISNFLLWDSAYAELYFTDTLWPDWTATEFETALRHFGSRERRFGGVISDSEKSGC
ncbi:polyprenyl diphosphate synthase [Candidatus Haliotispira prima]|uniref:Isoprenyl transferase n=1 Tax=Candidatus Haliotispira prima TaxID=3034016 RepID=A0ABY8MFX0_9SPIO|nr:polyprenyl diphosphate synthase [Candidatus Haliotispira prima]